METRTGGTPVVFTKFLRTGHNYICPSTIARNVVHRHAQTKYCDNSALYGPLPHRDSVNCRVFYSSVFFVTRENSSLIHLQKTLQSPHNCTVGPSLRMWTVVCSGPQVSGCFIYDLLLNFFSLALSVHSGKLHSAQNERHEFVLILQRTCLSSCFHLSFLCQPILW